MGMEAVRPLLDRQLNSSYTRPCLPLPWGDVAGDGGWANWPEGVVRRDWIGLTTKKGIACAGMFNLETEKIASHQIISTPVFMPRGFVYLRYVVLICMKSVAISDS